MRSRFQENTKKNENSTVTEGCEKFHGRRIYFRISVIGILLCGLACLVVWTEISSSSLFRLSVPSLYVMRQSVQSFFLPRRNAHINSFFSSSIFDLNSLDLNMTDESRFTMDKKIGSGAYSNVYLAYDNLEKKNVAVKILKHKKWMKLRREVKMLDTVQDGPNVIKLVGRSLQKSSGNPMLIFEYIIGDKPKPLYLNFTDSDVRYFMFQILTTLKYTHQQGIMHRDVKPRNILINRGNRELRIIDWGLADFYHPNRTYSYRVSTRHYKAPELLIGALTKGLYHYGIDVWSAGCVFASMIFDKYPFLPGENNEDQLMKITELIGSDALFDYLELFKKQLPNYAFQEFLYLKESEMRSLYAGLPLDSFVNERNRHKATVDALDLLSQMLQVDMQKRITVDEALNHKYFLQNIVI